MFVWRAKGFASLVDFERCGLISASYLTKINVNIRLKILKLIQEALWPKNVFM